MKYKLEIFDPKQPVMKFIELKPHRFVGKVDILVVIGYSSLRGGFIEHGFISAN